MGDIGRKSVKWSMFGFNLILCLAGLLLITLGTIANTSPEILPFYLQGKTGMEMFPVAAIIIGGILFVLAFLGCVGVVCKNLYLLVAFATLLGVLSLIQLGLGIAASATTDKIASHAVKEWSGYMPKNFNSSQDDLKDFYIIQKTLHCCGLENYDDWFSVSSKTVPLSCCNSSSCTEKFLTKEQLDLKCQQGNSSKCPIFTHGCSDDIRSRVKNLFAVLSGVTIGFAVIQFIGVALSCYLAKRVKSGYVYAD